MNDENEADRTEPRRLSRRGLLVSAGAGAAAIAAWRIGTGGESAPATVSGNLNAEQYPPVTPTSIPAVCDIVTFFDRSQALTIEAMTARLVPGSARDPGAKEACVTGYIDAKLAAFESFSEPTYIHGPFAEESKSVPGQQVGAKDKILVSADQLERSGFQSDLTPQQAYRRGIASLDRLCRARFGRRFRDLGSSRQDQVLSWLEADQGGHAFEEPGASDFFEMVLKDTIQGMFADPAYGGNRGFAGWELIGFPGAQRFYTPEEMLNGTDKRPQGIASMPASHPGHPDSDAILPVSGSDRG